MTAHQDDGTVSSSQAIHSAWLERRAREQKQRRASWEGWAIVVMVASYLVTVLAVIGRVAGWVAR